jgi:peptidoglycan/LPS O-acetylase OafA/YrhL
MKSTSLNSNWVNGLDSIRFILAMIVFLSHLSNEPAAYLKALDIPFLHWIGIGVNHLFLGPGAVIAFFVISGFVIHFPFRKKRLELKSFLTRRWLRIGIPLVVVVVMASYFNSFWLIPIWSLYCELIYYTIYPLLRKLPLSWKTQFIISFVMALVLIACFANGEINSMFAQKNVGYTGSYAALGDTLTWIVGLPCWLLGVYLADSIDSNAKSNSTMKIYWIRITMLVFSVLLVGLKFHLFVSYIITLNFFALALAYWLKNEIIYFKDRPSSQLLEWAGKFSYSLYLIHGLSISLISLLLPSNISTYSLYVMLTLLFSYVLYLLVENPSHRFSKYVADKIK